MGMVRLQVDIKDVSHEVTFNIREDVNMAGKWYTEDWEAVIRMAVAAVTASIKSTEEG